MDPFVFRNIRTVSAVFFHNVIDVMEQVSEEGIKQVETLIESSYKAGMNCILLPHKKWKNKSFHIHRISMFNQNKDLGDHLFDGATVGAMVSSPLRIVRFCEKRLST